MVNKHWIPEPFKAPPTDLCELFKALPAGCPPYARVTLILKLLTKSAKAVLVAPLGHDELRRWLPLSRIRINEKQFGFPQGCAEFNLPAWLYDQVRAEILTKARLSAQA